MLRRVLLLCWALCVGGTTAPTLPTPATKAPTTPKPTAPPTPFVVPALPISKANAAYPDCRAELIFVIDVSGSVSPPNQKIMMHFVDSMIVEVEKNILDGRYGVVVFGIDGVSSPPAKDFPSISQPVPGPYGNGADASTELFFELDHLKYNCTNCTKQGNTALNVANWSQLNLLYDVVYYGYLTPTWDALDIAYDQFRTKGDPTIPGRYLILVTDGVPNDGTCPTDDVTDPGCIEPISKTNASVNRLKEGGLLITVGVALNEGTQKLMVDWASEPRDILAIPDADFNTLASLIPRILALLCPVATSEPCLEAGATYVEVVGSGFLDTGKIRCKFVREGKAPDPAHETAGAFIRDDVIHCPLPLDTGTFFPGTWNLTFTLDGRGFRDGAVFKYGTVCHPELLVIWWPFIALALLPLAFCRPAKVAPASTTKVTRGVARPAPAATEEYEEYEEVEEIVAPPPPVNKWKVAPTAYIGFGRARLSVDWAGVAPESAPHEGVRKKVVKKVVTDQQPVPVAAPATVPTPAAQEAPTTTTTTSRPPIVEEPPDWVNSFMDRVASVFCCCCVNKK